MMVFNLFEFCNSEAPFGAFCGQLLAEHSLTRYFFIKHVFIKIYADFYQSILALSTVNVLCVCRHAVGVTTTSRLKIIHNLVEAREFFVR